MYAIIKTGGKQFKVTNGDQIKIEKLDVEPGTEVTFDVLMIGEGSDVKVGSPIVSGASVKAKVLEHGKADKIVVFKFKPKKGYRRTQGHRQPFTLIEITTIS